MAQYLDWNGLGTVVTAIKGYITNVIANKADKTELAGKVDKVDGKGLSTNDYTTADKNALANKVDKVSGKGLSTNDYTTADKNALANKVDKVSGKALSTNDFTTAYKNKLDGIAAQANNYTLPVASRTTLGGVKVGGNITLNSDNELSLSYVDASMVSIEPYNGTTYHNVESACNSIEERLAANTAAINALPTPEVYNGKNCINVNDVYVPAGQNNLDFPACTLPDALFYIANMWEMPRIQTPYGDDSQRVTNVEYVTNAIADAISGISGISYSIVTALPSTGEAGTIYLLSHGGSAPDIYDEYIWVNNAFEKIGTTAVDLSDYLKTTDMVAITATEINALFQ